ncbi:MAG: hypothetical protein L0221_01230 [Chloroflexi bacterium]|nr:hypothetical protein [Chloroflexota bacterium]
MDPTTSLALVLAAIVGLLATIIILGRQRRRDEAEGESEFAVSTEGEKRCPKCGMGNMWTDRTCISCGADLRG